MPAAETITTRPPARTGVAIAAERLVKTYATHGRKTQPVRALDGLSITVDRGTIFGLLGPNGAGKSTTIKILTTLARPDAGTAQIEGVDVLKRPDQVRRMIGVVAQRSGSDPMATGRENLILQGHLFGMSGPAVKARAASVLENLAHVRDLRVTGRALSARSDDGASAVPGILAALERAGVPVAAVTVARPSLDDVYLRHTGHRYASDPDVTTLAENEESQS